MSQQLNLLGLNLPWSCHLGHLVKTVMWPTWMTRRPEWPFFYRCFDLLQIKVLSLLSPDSKAGRYWIGPSRGTKGRRALHKADTSNRWGRHWRSNGSLYLRQAGVEDHRKIKVFCWWENWNAALSRAHVPNSCGGRDPISYVISSRSYVTPPHRSGLAVTQISSLWRRAEL